VKEEARVANARLPCTSSGEKRMKAVPANRPPDQRRWPFWLATWDRPPKVVLLGPFQEPSLELKEGSMNHQQPSALSTTPVVCPLPLTHQEMLNIHAALNKWIETYPPEESTDFAQRALLMFKFQRRRSPFLRRSLSLKEAL
jgi:hypothetical protein